MSLVEVAAAMSLIEVSAGPTLELQGDVTSSPAYGSNAEKKPELSCFSAKVCFKNGEEEGEKIEKSNGFCFEKKLKEAISSESSSIGVAGESDLTEDDEEEEEVQSKFRVGLGSLESLEESLPIKRGLSNVFSGKSKSFANLSEVKSLKDLQKHDNTFNKRRRTLMACDWARKSFYSSSNSSSMPHLPLEGDNQEDRPEKDEESDSEPDEKKSETSTPLSPPLNNRRFKSLKAFNPKSRFSASIII